MMKNENKQMPSIKSIQTMTKNHFTICKRNERYVIRVHGNKITSDCNWFALKIRIHFRGEQKTMSKTIANSIHKQKSISIIKYLKKKYNKIRINIPNIKYTHSKQK